MRILKTLLVCIVGLFVLSGCGAPSKDQEVSARSMVAKPQQQAISAMATVTAVTKEAVADKPGVARVVMMLDKQAQYSTSREGNQLIVNVFNAKMKSSIKQLEVRDPVVKLITTKQIGNSVKGVVDLVNQDVAYTPSTATDPFRIVIDIWQISSKTALKQPLGEKEGASGVSKPVQAIEVKPSRAQTPEASPKTQEITVDVRKTPEGQPFKETVVATSPGAPSAPATQEVPAQLQWFSAKLSQELQEKEQLKQQLLDAEKSFAVKDSMIQVLERKVKEANTRIVELEEELIKVKSNSSIVEQERDEIKRTLTQLEQATGEQAKTNADLSARSEQLVTNVQSFKTQIDSLTAERDGLRNQVETYSNETTALKSERDGLQSQAETCSNELTAMKDTTAKLSGIEKELQVKEYELSRLRQAIGAAAGLLTGKPGEVSSRAPQTEVSRTMSAEVPAVKPEAQAGKPTSTEGSEGNVQATEASQMPTDQQLTIADLIRQQQLTEQTAGPGDYVLGPEDVIRIKVLKEENLDKTVTVSSDGFITYPLLGDLRVEGLTTAQVDAQITSLLARDFLVEPEVEIEVVKQRSKKVYIMGAVKQPGYQELSRDQRLLGTLLNAGGPVSFDTEARILRLPKGEMSAEGTMDTLAPIAVDLNKLFVQGDQTQNIVLQDGDVLMVASKTQSPGTSQGLGDQQFYVVGSVVNPGVYNYKPNDTVLDAVLRAGGFTEFASRNSVKMVREADGKTRTFQIKMKDVMDKGEMTKNMTIMPGDMIIVPESFF
jgi:polysaccharide export outer membrane protein